jgi:hypothetical protein
VHESPQEGARGKYQATRIDGLWYWALKSFPAPGSPFGKWYRVGFCQSCDGHPTADAARAHFREFLLKEQLRLSIPRGDGEHWTGCLKCIQQGKKPELLLKIVARRPALGDWLASKFGRITRRYALIAGGLYAWALCPAHQHRWVVEELLPEKLGDIVG